MHFTVLLAYYYQFIWEIQQPKLSTDGERQNKLKEEKGTVKTENSRLGMALDRRFKVILGVNRKNQLTIKLVDTEVLQAPATGK